MGEIMKTYAKKMQMVNKHEKLFSIVSHEERQIKIPIKFSIHTHRMTKQKIMTMPNADEKVERLQHV